MNTNFFIFFILTLLQAPSQNLPEGWYQLDILSYHGPTGYFHDKVSGALVQYNFGLMPSLPMDDATTSKCETRSIKGIVPNCVMSERPDYFKISEEIAGIHWTN